MLDIYKEYLVKLNKILDEYFQKHKLFIECRAGCSVCCKNSYFAVSELEFDLAREGLNRLSDSRKELIIQKAVRIFKERRAFLKECNDILSFSYECPFLENEVCSIYEYRPLLCRSHGLMYKDIEKQNKINMPYCVNIGLNYANIWDNKTRNFSKEKLNQLGMNMPPDAFDLSYSCLMRDAGNLEFGDVRMIIEWIILDIPDYEKVINS